MAKFASGKSKRLTLPDGEWIDVSESLSVGDMKRLRKLTGGSDDIMLFRLAYLFVRLTDWSFKDNGEPVPLTEDAFDALTSETVNQIGDAIDKLTAAEEREKNAMSGEPTKSEANSPSAS